MSADISTVAILSVTDLAKRGVDVRPPSSKTPDPMAKLLANRRKVAGETRETGNCLLQQKPRTHLRKTKSGSTSVNTNGWYMRDGHYYVSVSIGPKLLAIGGHRAFQAETLMDAYNILQSIEQAALKGDLDAEITAMFALSDEQKQKMSDGKFLARMAHAQRTMKATTRADKLKLAELLTDPANQERFQELAA